MENINSSNLQYKKRKKINRADIRRRKRKKYNRVFDFFRNFILLVLVFISLYFTFKVITNYSEIAKINGEIELIEEEIALKQSQRDALSVELEPYKATSRIESIAKLELGLDYPRSDQIVEIDMDDKENTTEIVEEEKGIVGNIISALRSGD